MPSDSSGLWDEQDGYFYDVLHLTDGRDIPIKVRSLVGLIPVTAAREFHANLPAPSCPSSPNAPTGTSRTIPSSRGAVLQRDRRRAAPTG